MCVMVRFENGNMSISGFLKQRAENGGLDPFRLDLAFLGPIFHPEDPQPLKYAFWSLWTENRVPQKREIQPRRGPPMLGPLTKGN